MGRLGFFWVLMAVAGAVLPVLHFQRWFAEHDLSFASLVEGWTANPATEGLMWSFGLAAVTLTLANLIHAQARSDWKSLVCTPLVWTVGLGAALPLFLWFITRRPRRGVKARDE